MRSPARPIRALIVTHNYPRFPGDPAGAFVARIAQGAAAQGIDVQVIAPHAPATSTSERIHGVGIRRFRYAPAAMERIAYTGGLHQGTLRSPMTALVFPGFLLAFANSVRQSVRRFRPDLIHAHWWFPAGWLVSRTRVPYLITCHGSDVRLLERSRFARRIAVPVFRKAAEVTTVSRFLANDLRLSLPDIAREVQVTPMPVDVSSFLNGTKQSRATPPRVLYAGNLVPSKGVDLLLRAAAELSRRGVEYQVKILGEGPALGELRSLAQALRLGPRVTWAPFVSQPHMPAEYGASTVTVLPSRGQAEGLGLTLVEALLAGSAVVGTPAGGIPEVVRHEETGLLARDEDPTDLANQIQRLLADQPLRERLVRAGKEHVLRTYAPEPATAAFVELYRAIVARHAND